VRFVEQQQHRLTVDVVRLRPVTHVCLLHKVQVGAERVDAADEGVLRGTYGGKQLRVEGRDVGHSSPDANGPSLDTASAGTAH
jgi:hypothetical protein